ncbi:unnamed protein product [Prunus armeniaca]|uniref:Uncharacterized protein n=1 Tax=Prunus armeniaca TaxID=36596 RepID=A0A6J5X5C8_PRUAR|nr:unnamed protein product [Prunus armeniaca]
MESQSKRHLMMFSANKLWKDINEELLIRPTDVPRPVLMRTLNLTRVVDLLYKRGEASTHVGKQMKDTVTSLFY